MKKPKVLAYYLPAYHRIKENDEWYGEGFTEWDTTKKGVVYHKCQHQPRVPLNGNYYNLTNAEDILWQCELAEQYGVDGFVFYHYWFNGRLILEKPAEIYLRDARLNREFCFAWANEEWRNTWNTKTGDFELLIEQRYDREEDWYDHFNYLLDFFKDPRYIKVDNKPVFMIYRIQRIPDFESKFQLWNRLAQENGFDGIYLIQMINHDAGVALRSPVIDAKVDFEPNKTLYSKQSYAVKPWRIRKMLYHKIVGKSKKLYQKIYDIVNYKSYYKTVLKKPYIKRDPTYYYSLCSGWDNTPRRSKRGMFFKNCNPKEFMKFFSKSYERTVKEGKQFLFIFAWNEWGEGAYLEPDTKFGYGFLETIKTVVDGVDTKS